jgi:general secretion pathway protein I
VSRGALRKEVPGGRPPESLPGFTLLEILVAMAILSMVLLAVYRLQAQSISATRSARFQAVAPLLARQKLADLERLARNGPLSDAGDFGEQHPGFTWQATVERVSSERLGEVGVDLRRIDLAIFFDSGDLAYRVRTYRFLQQ